MAPERRDVTRAWDGLNPPLSDWLLDAISSFGHEKMTPVQANVIPLFMVSSLENNMFNQCSYIAGKQGRRRWLVAKQRRGISLFSF